MDHVLPFLVGTAYQLERYGVLQHSSSVSIKSLLSTDPDTADAALEGLAAESLDVSSCVLCLVLVPAHMIPTEILHFFSTVLGDIATISIFRHYWQPEKYFALIRASSVEAAVRLRGDFHGQLMSSLDCAFCLLLPVSDVAFCRRIEDLGHVLADTPAEDGVQQKVSGGDSLMDLFAVQRASSPHSRCLRERIVGLEGGASPSTRLSTPSPVAGLVRKVWPLQYHTLHR